MGSIVGICKKDIFKSNDFIKCVDLLKYRGTDEQSIEQFPGYVVGFNRMITSNAQIQPYYSEGSKLVVIVDGEIYNSKELMSHIGINKNEKKLNVNYLISELYKKYGVKSFKLFNGMFVIHIYDRTKNKIYIVKDKLGLKPLFYSSNSDSVIFASEAKAIISFIGKAKIDYSSSLNMIFLAGRPPLSSTIFKDINDLEQAHYLLIDVDSSKAKIFKYFDISDFISEDAYKENSLMTKNEIKEKFYDTFKSTVKRHLITDAGTGFLFSAGLDSSMISAISKDSVDRMNLYYYESEMHDYSKYTNLFVDKFNANLFKLKTDDIKFIIDLPLMVYCFEGVGKEEGSPMSNISKIASDNGDKVLLTGDGDTILGGSAVHASFYARSKFNNNPITSSFVRVMNKIIPEVFRSGVKPEALDYLFFPTGSHHSEVLTNILLFKGERLKEWKDKIDIYSFVKNKTERETQAFILDDTTYRFQRYMIRQERASSRHSNQFRYPYLDDEIIKLSVNMPLHIKQRINFFRGLTGNGKRGVFIEGKSICRDVATMAGVPKEIVHRRETGSPFNSINYMRTIIKHWSLENLSQHLSIDEKMLKYVALESYNNEISRVHYGFIVMEILIRIFENNQSPHDIADEFKWILKKYN
jgi:asparagine synthase (glutamine-hydrolysing)